MKTLIINSYAGSLVLAAKQAGATILASLEDAGYGADIQKANFLELDVRETVDEWGDWDLRDTVVVAHPPCSAFSNQTGGNHQARGVRAPKFECTARVLRYAMKRQALAVMVESVTGAFDGARQVHDAFAEKYGYRLFRIFQNAATFGLPQWRPRFWVVFARMDAGSETLRLAVENRPLTRVADVVTHDGETLPSLLEDFNQQLGLLAERGLTKEQVRRVLDTPGNISATIKNLLKLKETVQEVSAKYCISGKFMSSNLRVLNPNDLSGVLLANSFWMVSGKLLTIKDYCAMQGFPRNYKWPEHRKHRFREYLSRGICPPVGAWLLREVGNYLGLGTSNTRTFEELMTRRKEYLVMDGGFIDVSAREEEQAEQERVTSGKVSARRQVARATSSTSFVIESLGRPTHHLEKFWSYIYLRHLIWHKRFVLRLPAPWTKNEVLATRRFPNIYRCLDRGTVYMHKHILHGRELTEGNLWALVTYRVLNRVDTFEHVRAKRGKLFTINDCDEVEVLRLLRDRDAVGPVFTGAHLTMPSNGESKIEAYAKLCRVISGLCPMVVKAIESAQTLGEVHDALQWFPAIGKFIAYGVCHDLIYAGMVPHTENDLITDGPGSRHGASLIFERATPKSVIACLWNEQEAGMSKVEQRMGQPYRWFDNRQLSIKNIEDALCEYGRYANIVSGGKTREWFVPQREDFFYDEGGNFDCRSVQTSPSRSKSEATHGLSLGSAQEFSLENAGARSSS